MSQPMTSWRHHPGRLTGLLLGALPTILLIACSLAPARSGEDAHTYLLSPDTLSLNDTGPSDKRGTATLLVNVPQAQAGFDSLRMAYLLRPHEVRYYASNQWADTPGRMLARLLTQTLDRSGSWRAVVQLPSSVRGDYRLDTEDLAIQQEFFSQPSRLRLTLRVQLIELPTQAVIAARQFEIVEDALSDDAYGGVLAANRAASKLLAQLSDWVNASLNEKTRRGR